MDRRVAFASRVASRACLFFVMLLALSDVPWSMARAEGLSGYLEYDYTRNDSEATISGSPSISSRSEAITQLYNLTLERKLFPNLNLLASGIFQRQNNSFAVEGAGETGTATNTLRPYIDLTLRTPLYYADVAYSRNDEDIKSSGAPILKTVRESYVSTLYWRPDRFPDLKLQYYRDHLYDKDRSRVDTVTNQYQLTSNYRPSDPLLLYYQGTLRETDLQLADTSTKETTNVGRVNYFNAWRQRRLTFGLDYNITNQRIETTTSGSGQVPVRLFPFAGLSALSDTPDDVVLTSNPALIDGNFTATAGINLGLPPPGGDNKLRNMGLDFLVDTELNTLYVWVQQDVAQVANAFTWRIYTSEDNQNWVFRQIVSPATWSSTFNRFELRFTNVKARYVKAVTAPLSPTVPFASSYPNILVTELQAEIQVPASEISGKLSSTFQNGTADFRAILMESWNLTYEFTYVFTKRDPGNLYYTASNGLSFFRQFNPVFSGRGRASFETGQEQAGYRNAVLYTASVTTAPVQTLYQSLTLSGKEETVGGDRSSDVALQLYNVAKLYEGIDVNLGSGMSFQEQPTGRRNRNTHVNAGATIVPNQKVNLTLLYNGTKTVTSGGDLSGEVTEYTRAGEADLAVTPVQTVYLFGSYRIEKSSTSESRNILNYSLNWSPFPDGTLHFTFYYNETVRSDDTRDRSIVPSARWYFTKTSYVNLSYQNLKTEAPALTTKSDVYSGTVRINF